MHQKFFLFWALVMAGHSAMPDDLCRFEDIADKINGPKPEKKKAPLTAYTRFTSAHFAEERSKSQGGKGGEVFKAVAARWRALSDSEKASYKP